MKNLNNIGTKEAELKFGWQTALIVVICAIKVKKILDYWINYLLKKGVRNVWEKN